MSNYELALKIATEAHKGQVDKAGVPYINHPLTVASLVETEEEKIVHYYMILLKIQILLNKIY